MRQPSRFLNSLRAIERRRPQDRSEIRRRAGHGDRRLSQAEPADG